MAWHRIVAAPDSEWTRLTVAGIDLLVVRVGDDWHAVEDRCSHANCAFSTDGELDGTTLICNCHGSEFDVVTGAPLVMPAVDPIRTFGVRRRAGSLEVDL